ncbi:LPS export ABC transporter permease LptG [Ahrensia sp. 13_GOM-1096m]|uniref:LPS export ABC transporter permease LptG n=1 Tax=Ahrensia sp. 13_GOM-1096m TaxID=1380380 RepID=UPI00047B83F5|nr:LPS export ABC transporter permease LptG [Ahrensia sp. 13_GOM-1096m]
MLGRTLQLYIFKYMLKMTIYFFLGIALLIFLIDFTEMNNRFGNLQGYSSSLGIYITTMRLPFILSVAIPFVILAASMTTLIQLNKKNELVVARSVGVSAWQFLLPLWLAALIFGLFSIFVINPISAYGYSVATEMESTFRGQKKSADLFDDKRPWLRQDSEDGGSILIGAERVSGNGIVLLNPVFLELDGDGRIKRRLDARRARLENDRWILTETTASIVGQPSEDLGQIFVPTDIDPAVIREALVPPELVPFLQLSKQINAAQSFGVTSAPYRMQFQALLSTPLLLIAMTLIGATVSLRFARFGQSERMILGGIIAGFMLYVVTEVTKSFGGAGIISPIIAAWLPVAASSMFGIAYLLHREDG